MCVMCVCICVVCVYMCVVCVCVCVCVWASAGYEETSEQLTGYLFALTWNV